MIALLLTTLLACPDAAPVPACPPALVAADDLDAKIAAAGKDVAKLVELATATSAAGNEDGAKKVWKRVLEVDAANETARKALRHQYYDNKWHESFAELAKYKREEDARMKLKGLARFKDEWVPVTDVPFLTMGWIKDGTGAWKSPVDIAKEKQIAEWKAAGRQFRADDNSWIAPEDMDKWRALLWKCGDQWVDLAKANEHHAKLETHWELAGEHFTVWTTCDWEGGNLARWHADKAYPELVRIFGVEPARKPHFAVMNSLEQYNLVAGGNPPIIPESEGISSLHGAYFADLLFDEEARTPQYIGCGVSYWDRKDEKLARWGPFWARWAAAQSFADAIDPSWLAVSEWISGSGDQVPAYAAAFWSEKKIPRWLRYGAASYVERFMKNPLAAEGADPWDLRAFACAEIKKAGGLRKLDEVFAFALDLKEIDKSSRLYNEAGLLVSFLVDGAAGDKELAAKHEAFKAALKSGSKADVTAAGGALQKELARRERDIRKFAGL
jgi:hypothetical protein